MKDTGLKCSLYPFMAPHNYSSAQGMLSRSVAHVARMGVYWPVMDRALLNAFSIHYLIKDLLILDVRERE